jgi:hypothetical protein
MCAAPIQQGQRPQALVVDRQTPQALVVDCQWPQALVVDPRRKFTKDFCSLPEYKIYCERNEFKIENLWSQLNLDPQSKLDLQGKVQFLSKLDLDLLISKIMEPPVTPELKKISIHNLEPHFSKMGPPMGLGMAEPDRIIIARPLKELWSHIRNCKLPSIRLLVRVIVTVALGIFRGHLCDKVVLESEGSLFHSLKGHVEKVDRATMQAAYPYMLENAFVMVLKETPKQNVPISDSYKKINPQTIRDYYHRICKIDITPKEEGNTLQDLFKSKALELKAAPIKV